MFWQIIAIIRGSQSALEATQARSINISNKIYKYEVQLMYRYLGAK
jgi:hypothetical protein